MINDKLALFKEYILYWPVYKKFFSMFFLILALLQFVIPNNTFVFLYGTLLSKVSVIVCEPICSDVSGKLNLLVYPDGFLLVNQRFLSLFWLWGLLMFLVVIAPDGRTFLIILILSVLLNFTLNTLKLSTIIYVINAYTQKLIHVKPIVFSVVNTIYLCVIISLYNRFRKEICVFFNSLNISQDIAFLILKLLFVFVIISKVIAPILLILDYSGLSFIILSASSRILELFGYYPDVFPHRISGNEAGIRFAPQCLGITLMCVYASFIYFTGKSFLKKANYILIGILVINVLNIMRFVFLYVFMAQKSVTITNKLIHDFYNVIVYFFVFLLWVIWIEKFSDNDVVMKYINNKKAA